MEKHSNNAYYTIYEYNENGQLSNLSSNDFTMKLNHDLNGNVIQIDYNEGAFSTFYKFEYGERVAKIGQNNIINYDADGRLIGKLNYNFNYNPNGTLESITYLK